MTMQERPGWRPASCPISPDQPFGLRHACPEHLVVLGLVHTDCDKPHRCPACWRVLYEAMAATGDRIRYWHVYECAGCGQRVAMRFYLREHPAHRCRRFSHMRWRLRKLRR